jgi:hypothetical protein
VTLGSKNLSGQHSCYRANAFFLNVVTRAHSTVSHHIYTRFALMLSPYLHPGLSNVSFIQFLVQILCAFLIWPIRTAYPTNLILLCLINFLILDEEYTFWSSLPCNFSALFLLTLCYIQTFSDTISLCSSLRMADASVIRTCISCIRICGSKAPRNLNIGSIGKWVCKALYSIVKLC